MTMNQSSRREIVVVVVAVVVVTCDELDATASTIMGILWESSPPPIVPAISVVVLMD